MSNKLRKLSKSKTKKKYEEMTKEELLELFGETAVGQMERARLIGMKIGSTGILAFIKDMCENGSTVEDIKDYCIKSLLNTKNKTKDL